MLNGIGLMEMINKPKAKNVVKTKPIMASSFKKVVCLIHTIDKVASIPVKNAPKAYGKPKMEEITTPGTTEWESASPISDHPFSIKKQDKKAQVIPIHVLAIMAFVMYS